MLEWKLNTIIRLNISKDFWMLTYSHIYFTLIQTHFAHSYNNLF